MTFNKTLFEKIIIWRGRRINERQFILILSFMVGIFSGLAAIILKNTIHFTHHFIDQYIEIQGSNYLYLTLPAVGIIITVLWVSFFVKDNIGHGVTRIFV